MYPGATLNAFMARGKPKGHGINIKPQSTDRLLAITNALPDETVETAAQAILRERALDTSVPYNERVQMLRDEGMSNRQIQAMINPHAIADLNDKHPGGRTLHHCPKKKHGMDQARCIKDGCIIECPKCGAYISAGFGSRCRGCETREFTKQREEQDAARAEKERQKAEEEQREKAAGLTGRKKDKPRWSDHKREFQAHARMARVVAGRVSKKRKGKEPHADAAWRPLLAETSGADDDGDDDMEYEMEEMGRMDPERRRLCETVIASWLIEHHRDLLF